MSVPMGKHAVVVGAGMAGILAAQVLAQRFDRVTLVERDQLPDDAAFRKGVPQARHPHALLIKGLQIVSEMFPKIHQEFLDEGATEVEWPADMLLHGESGWEYRGPRGKGLVTVSASRPLLDWVIRRNVLADASITVLARHEVVGLTSTDGGRSVSGLAVRERGSADAEVVEMPADLVVDASGRESKATKWLADLGCAVPEETRINPRQGYSTAVFRREPGALDDWRTLVCAPYPERPRGCFLVPVEGDRWIATANGFGGDYPPLEMEGFLAFAKTLPGGIFHDVIAGSELLEPLRGYRDMANVRRHYERLSNQPERFLVIGDAACAFNPVYAQGLTAAALSVVVLRECLDEAARTNGFQGLSKRLQRKLADTTKGPWQFATSQDLSFPATEGRPGLGDRMMAPYFTRLQKASASGGPATYQMNRVMHMVEPATALFKPAMIREVLRPGRGGSPVPPLAAKSGTAAPAQETASE